MSAAVEKKRDKKVVPPPTKEELQELEQEHVVLCTTVSLCKLLACMRVSVSVHAVSSLPMVGTATTSATTFSSCLVA